MKKVTGLFLFLFAALTALAQKQEKPLVQFTGMVHNADSTKVIVPYVSIVNTTNRNEAGQTNYLGYFSFVVHEQDTIRFSCIGYHTIYVVIPAHVTSGSYMLQVLLKPQIPNLPVFRVFPWATAEDFTKDFLTMKVADDDLAIARKNLSASSIQTLEKTLPRDGSEIGGIQDFHNSVVNSHSIVNPLFNPFAWGSLIKSITDGDKSRTEQATPSSGNNSITGN